MKEITVDYLLGRIIQTGPSPLSRWRVLEFRGNRLRAINVETEERGDFDFKMVQKFILSGRITVE